ncbi:Sphingomyelin phosphodiesterase 2 [Paramecium bursaria]
MRKMKLKHKALKQGLTYQAESPSPSFFSGQMVDGGLVTLSRYPIISQSFKLFPYAVLSDNLASKGILYTKIDIQGKILHLFNTHLQASYIGKETNVNATVSTRVDQLLCFNKFMFKTIQENQYDKQDLIIIAGDFNVDARLREGFKITVLDQFPDIRQALNNPQRYFEYDGLLAILGGPNKLINLYFEKYNEHPVTYADCLDQESGDKLPLETVLTIKEDLNSQQCLDYIFQFVPENYNIQDCQIRVPNIFVEKFQIQGQKFTQLSDHYGIVCELQLNE